MNRISRIVFVCTDNTCRSIMAEAVMCSVCRNRRMEVMSRGLVVLFPEPLNPKAVAVLTGNQMKPVKTATEGLEQEDLNAETLVLTMTAKEKAEVLSRFPGVGAAAVLGDFVGRPGDIEEPHGGSLAEYGACYEYIDLLVKLAAEMIFRTAE